MHWLLARLGSVPNSAPQVAFSVDDVLDVCAADPFLAARIRLPGTGAWHRGMITLNTGYGPRPCALWDVSARTLDAPLGAGLRLVIQRLDIDWTVAWLVQGLPELADTLPPDVPLLSASQLLKHTVLCDPRQPSPFSSLFRTLVHDQSFASHSA
jgi:hypothetical protein